jgi:protein-disulfide isomerase
VLGTVAIAGAVFAAEVALDTREAQRQVALLGAPAPAATPRPEPPPASADASAAEEPEPAPDTPSDGKDADYWEQRASELQQTLDDPQKLEQYFTEKARQEFETAAPVTIDLEGVSRKGPADAPVQVVEFSDFLCPFCRNLAVALNQFVPQAEGRVAVYFKHFPLDQECNPSLPRSSHPGACKLALGAICAEYQGKFEAYHNRVFSAEGLRNPGTEDVVRLAGEAGLNPAAIRGCLEDPKASEDLAAQIEEAKRLEVQATPTLYVNGKKLPRINDFVAVVDREAQKKGFAPLSQ